MRENLKGGILFLAVLNNSTNIPESTGRYKEENTPPCSQGVYSLTVEFMNRIGTTAMNSFISSLLANDPMVTIRDHLVVTHPMPMEEPQVKLQKIQGPKVVLAECLFTDLSAAFPHYLILRTVCSHPCLLSGLYRET